MNPMKKLISILSLSLLFTACEETDILDQTGKLEVNDFNLPYLPNGYFYEGWLLVDGSYVSVGTINNDSIANNRARFSQIEVNDLNQAQAFAITVETSGNPAPSNYVLLLGQFNGNIAELTTDAELPNGILSISNRISGSYTVQNATVPSSDAGNYTENGIWFFKGTGNEKEKTLNLDYQGLNYQAWVQKVENNSLNTLNMGVITSDTLADNWRGFTKPEYQPNTPKFPGEDFLQQPATGTIYPENFFPMNVRGTKVFITPILPNYSSTTEPFPIILLEATIPQNAVVDPYLTREFQKNTQYRAKAIKQ